MQYLRNLVLFSRIDSSRLLHTAVHALTQFNQLQQLSDVLSAVLTVQGHLYLLLPITGTTIKTNTHAEGQPHGKPNSVCH